MQPGILTSGRFACSAARIFDGESTLADHAVVIGNGVVEDIVPRCSLPEGLPSLHENDCTIIPGLIDTHVHFMRWQGPLFLANGVTTIRDVGNDLEWILARRRECTEQSWPRIFCVGPLLDGPVPFHRIVSRRCTDRNDAVAAVRETIAAGVDGIKLYVGLRPEWLPAMSVEAHTSGRKVSMHCSIGGVLAAGRAGVDESFHLDGMLSDIWPEHPAGWLNVWGMPEFAGTWNRQHEVADAVRALGMTITPTLSYWDSQWRVRTGGYAGSDELRYVSDAVIRWQADQPADPGGAEQWLKAMRAAQRFIGLLSERGVPVLAGTDVPCGAVPPGLSLWREMALLAEAGLSPTQALRSATSDAAAFMGQSNLGRLRKGAAADMILVRGNPMDCIPVRPAIITVIRGGTVYRPEDLLGSTDTASTTVESEPWGIQFALANPGNKKHAP